MALSVSLPHQLQLWLQDFYRLDALAPVDLFLTGSLPGHGVSETLWVAQDGDELLLGLQFDASVLERLNTAGSLDAFPVWRLQDFWLVLEGVSHYLCLGWHAEHDRAISALDLETQAEIDKFVSAWELGRETGLGDIAQGVKELLFGNWQFADGAPPELYERYHQASTQAERYCAFLTRRYRDDRHGLREELRGFFRKPPARRREYIRALPY